MLPTRGYRDRLRDAPQVAEHNAQQTRVLRRRQREVFDREIANFSQVICFDNRGAGRSSAPDIPYSIRGMADDLAALLDHLGPVRTSLATACAG